MGLTAAQFYEQTSVVGTNTPDAMRDVMWFLNGTHPTATNNTPYQCIDCYDGTTREQPSGGLMSNLSSGNLWKPGETTALPLTSWATFQAPGGSVAAQWQMYCRHETFAEFSMSMIPYNDWSVGAGADASPTLPTRILMQPLGTSGIDPAFTNSTTQLYTIVLDEGMALVVRTESSGMTGAEWLFLGEINSWNSETDDARPFLITLNSIVPNWQSGATFRRFSPIDDSTIINVSIEPSANATMGSPTTYNDLGVEYIAPVTAYASTASHRFRMGTFRNVASVDETVVSNRATMGVTASDYRLMVWGRVTDQPRLVVDYPPGTSLPAGHTLVAEQTIPNELLAPSRDTTPPTISFVSPLPGANIRPDTTITLDVTDNVNSLLSVQLRVAFELASPPRATETIHSGDQIGKFEPLYEGCSVTTITDGFRFVLTRSGGWPSTPKFTASATDMDGNRA